MKCSNNIEDDTTAITETSTFKKPTEDEKPSDKTNKKSLNSLIENLAQQKQFGFERDDFSINEFYKGYEHGISTETKLNLDHINGSDCSVYQSVSKNPDNGENKVTELQLEVCLINNDINRVKNIIFLGC